MLKGFGSWTAQSVAKGWSLVMVICIVSRFSAYQTAGFFAHQGRAGNPGFKSLNVISASKTNSDTV